MDSMKTSRKASGGPTGEPKGIMEIPSFQCIAEVCLQHAEETTTNFQCGEHPEDTPRTQENVSFVAQQRDSALKFSSQPR